MQVRNQEYFRAGEEDLCNNSTSINNLSKAQQKETPQRNILEPFFLDTLKTTFWMENVNPKWTQSEPIFPKSGHLFWISKRSPLPPMLFARQWVWLNMHHYPWICLNILENAWMNCCDYAWALARLCIWGLRRVPNVSLWIHTPQ